MGDVVNLNKFRKRKAKVQREKRAEVNRRVHGRTKAERALEEANKRRQSTKVEGSLLDKSPKRSDDET